MYEAEALTGFNMPFFKIYKLSKYYQYQVINNLSTQGKYAVKKEITFPPLLFLHYTRLNSRSWYQKNSCSFCNIPTYIFPRTFGVKVTNG